MECKGPGGSPSLIELAKACEDARKRDKAVVRTAACAGAGFGAGVGVGYGGGCGVGGDLDSTAARIGMLATAGGIVGAALGHAYVTFKGEEKEALRKFVKNCHLEEVVVKK